MKRLASRHHSKSMDGVPRLPVIRSNTAFENKIKWTTEKKLQIVFGTIVLVPFRLALLSTVAILVLILSTLLALSFHFKKSPADHVGRWQRFIVDYLIRGVLGRLVLFALGFTSPRITGSMSSYKTAPITVIAPHTSVFDYIMAFMICQGSFVWQRSGKNYPLLERLFSWSEVIWADKNNTQDGISRRVAIEKRLLSKNFLRQIMIFPEDIIHGPDVLTSFSAAAFEHGVPVQPVVFQYLDSQEWTGASIDRSVWKTIWFTLCQTTNHFEATCLNVCRPSDMEKNSPGVFAERVCNIHNSKLNGTVTGHTAEDKALCIVAAELGLPISAGQVEYAVFKGHCDLKQADLCRLLRHFARLDEKKDGKKDGLVTKEDFVRCIKWPFSKEIDEYFFHCDTGAEGIMSFRDYAVAYNTLILPHVKDDDLLEDAFGAFSTRVGSREDKIPKPRHITMDSLKDGLQAHSPLFVHGCHMDFFYDLCPDGNPISLETFVARISNTPDYVYLLHGLVNFGE